MSYAIREAEEKEWPSLKELIYKLQSYNIPSTRKVDPSRFEKIVRLALDHVEASVRAGTGKFIALCAHDESAGELAGYCIVELEDRNPVLLARQAFILDIGVDEKYWGKYGWWPLMKEAIARGFKAGYPVIGGTITKGNLRCLRPATRFLGFHVIGTQWARHVAEPGAGDSGGVEIVSPSDSTGLARVMELARKNFPLRFASCAGEVRDLAGGFESRWLSDARRLLAEGGAVAILSGETYALLKRGEIEAATGEEQGVILDMSLDERSWESGTARKLLKKAEALCAESSLSYLVARLPKELDRAAEAENFLFERYEIARFP